MRSKYEIKQYCLVPPPYGGITVYVGRLIEKLTLDGYAVGGYYTKENNNSDIRNSELFNLQDTPSSSSFIGKYYQRIIKTFIKVKQILPYKLIHYHGLEHLVLFYFFYIFLHKKIVITVHSSMIENFYRNTTIVNRYFMKKLAGANVQWIAVSQQACECMYRLPFKFKNPIPVIPAYIPIESVDTDPLPFDLNQYIETHDKNIVFYARSFMYNNGVDVYGFDVALRMFVNIKKVYKSTVGMIVCISEATDAEKMNTLFQRARQLGIKDNIYWQLNPLKNIGELWKKIDLYVRPTSTDGDSVAVREVLDAGVVVVASDVCWRPERVITYQWNNDNDLCDKIILGLNRKKQRPNLDYSCYKSMLDVYKRMLK